MTVDHHEMDVHASLVMNYIELFMIFLWLYVDL